MTKSLRPARSDARLVVRSPCTPQDSDSAAPGQFRQVIDPLPLLGVRFAPRLDDSNRAPAGRRLALPLTIDRVGAVGRVTAPAVEVSFDDGTTWLPVPVHRTRGGEAGEWVVTVDHPAAPGFVSLRATAGDDRGNTVEQTAIRAYELLP